MLKVDFTNEMVFSFDGPNLCLLGNENDFLQLAKSISDLTGASGINIELLKLQFVTNTGDDKEIFFKSKSGSKLLGVFDKENKLVFELDPRYWERIFKYFILMSWKKSTYYLNEYESCLRDLELEQECNFICSSEF
ncbi:hypothetical protein [Flavihumibacter sp. CACIAM 22H1]|uniref:hypothetical protein n=1 Tax=Flavihumibacter sp. CACIAM 22H1 TaxID=1812911 RepID=UPI0007A84FE7|nr:hypothetical protein [Flavihumibacter sp. CACIAM 22H1]KYP13826.1 MAG: hypothetical protein A1D16_11460 [Flavihumibacter sp. CACIAM 22H1]